MGLKIHIDDFSRERWEQCAAAFADYSIYQTWPYQQVRCEMDGQNISRVIVTDDADNPVLMCQVRIKHIKPLGLKIGYVQWGPLLRRKDNGQCPAEALQLLRDAFVGNHVSILRLTPNVKNDAESSPVDSILVQNGFERVAGYNSYRTFLLKIDGSHDEIRARLHKSFRRDLKTAEKNGLIIQQGTADEYCAVLRDLYGKLVARKDFKGLDPDEFIKTQAILSPCEKMNFVLATKDNEPAAILLSAPFGDTSIVLLASVSEKGLSCGASYLVWYQGAIAAHDAGFKTYDLGGIDPVNNPKVFQFKARIGGDDTSYIGAYEAASGSAVKCIWRMTEKIYRFLKK